MKQRLALLLSVTAGLLAISACSGGVVVRVPPPEPRYGVVGVAPGAGFVWTDGFWDWRGGNWVWVGGSWRHAPYRGAVWVPAHWTAAGGRYHFVRGHWRR